MEIFYKKSSKELLFIKTILSCAIVSKQWRSIVMDNLYRLPKMLPMSYCLPREHTPPLLMHFNDGGTVGKINFLYVPDNKFFTDYSVADIIGNWIAGSSNGCLVLTELLGKKINVLNLLTRAQVSLPSSFNIKCRDYSNRNVQPEFDGLTFIRKAIIINEHNSRNLQCCIIVAIVSLSRELSFCRLGDDKWTTIQGCHNPVTDVIYYNDTLYAVLWGGELVSFDIEHQCAKVVAGHAKFNYNLGMEYLVESTSGNLLLAVRHKECSTSTLECSTTDFSVYKLEEVDETQIGISVRHTVNRVWVELKSLGDQILFLGRTSKSVPASLFPNLKGNCIYFTDDDLSYRHVRSVSRAKAGTKEFKVEKYDMGIYDMEEDNIQPIGFMDDNIFGAPPPLWFEPNLWLKNN